MDTKIFTFYIKKSAYLYYNSFAFNKNNFHGRAAVKISLHSTLSILKTSISKSFRLLSNSIFDVFECKSSIFPSILLAKNFCDAGQDSMLRKPQCRPPDKSANWKI